MFVMFLMKGSDINYFMVARFKGSFCRHCFTKTLSSNEVFYNVGGY